MPLPIPLATSHNRTLCINFHINLLSLAAAFEKAFNAGDLSNARDILAIPQRIQSFLDAKAAVEQAGVLPPEQASVLESEYGYVSWETDHGPEIEELSTKLATALSEFSTETRMYHIEMINGRPENVLSTDEADRTYVKTRLAAVMRHFVYRNPLTNQRVAEVLAAAAAASE